MKEFSCSIEASNCLKAGKILIHPTEGVWGLGCDAFNTNACKKISTLKQRPDNKNFILLSPSISFAIENSAHINALQQEFLESVWPGHVTPVTPPLSECVQLQAPVEEDGHGPLARRPVRGL